MIAPVCDLSAVRAHRALQQQFAAHPPTRLALEAWHMAFKAQAAWVAYWVAMGRFHAQFLGGGR